MTWGELAATVTQSRAQQEPARSTVDTLMDDRIAWQSFGAKDGMSVPAVYASVRLIASAIDQLVLTAPGDPDWLRYPRKTGSIFDQGDLIQFIVSSMAIRGRAWLHAERLGDSWRLDPVLDDQVAVQVGVADAGYMTLQFALAGRPIQRLPIYQEIGGRATWADRGSWLIHIPYLVTPEHPEGIGPLQAARAALDGYAAVERQAADLLDNGTYSGGRLETDQDITPETALRYQTTWMKNRKTGAIPVLGAGLRYVNDLIDPTDAQWLESRQFNAQQVAQMYGIPPDYLGMAMSGGSSSLSYSNSRDNDRRFRRNCLEAFTGQIGDALSVLLRTQKDRVTWDWTGWEDAPTGHGDERSGDAPSDPAV